MNQPQPWSWEIKSPNFSCTGVKRAVDARDAATRAMTEELSDGKLIGQAIGFPVDALAYIPANGITHHTLRVGAMSVEVRLLDLSTASPSGANEGLAGDDGVDGGAANELNTCSICGAKVHQIIGCPSGAELCQDCFDNGLD